MRNNAASNPVELQEMPRSGDWEESSQEQISSGRQRPRDFHPKNVVDHAGRGVWDRVTSYAFKYEMLAKKLERHHVTGMSRNEIAFRYSHQYWEMRDLLKLNS